jgi:hypothetical protein
LIVAEAKRLPLLRKKLISSSVKRRFAAESSLSMLVRNGCRRKRVNSEVLKESLNMLGIFLRA